ncbi:MAG: sigma-70 family RNA polymerase sigma factor [Planctomycetaceae bacterium]|nr:sigma-70 family RNA polymerase sigma factor [Planctomycetaceae bacterium]
MTRVMTRPETDSDVEHSSAGIANEARLVDEARRGNKSAFGELVLRYERRVLRLILQFIRDESLAEDLAQEAFVRAYQRLEQFDPSRRFGPWLFRIAVNLTLDHLRRRKRRGLWALFSETPGERSPDPAVVDPRQALDLSQEVQKVLEQLPETYRTVLVLRDLENFSTSEIAAILSRKEATVRWRLAEARSRFGQLWTKRLNAGEASPVDNDATKSDEDEAA